MGRLDDIDKEVISRLQVNGRATLKRIGEGLGLTSMGIKKRMDKLLKQGFIKISASLNLEKLGLHAALIFLEVEDGESRRNILERFRECPRIIYIFNALSGYNMISLSIAEDQDTLESESMEKCSLRSQEGVRRSEFYPISNVNYEPFLNVRWHLACKRNSIAPCKVDCESCERYTSHKCLGCPATKHYRGPL